LHRESKTGSIFYFYKLFGINPWRDVEPSLLYSNTENYKGYAKKENYRNHHPKRKLLIATSKVSKYLYDV
jgi:hypothetical protein